MSASYVLFSRLVKAAIAFVVLHAIVFAAPAILSGDPDKLESTLLLWSGMSVSILAALFIVVLPLMIILGTPLDAQSWARRVRWSASLAIGLGAFGFFFISGPGSVVVPALAALGAATGLGFAMMHREPRRWAVN